MMDPGRGRERDEFGCGPGEVVNFVVMEQEMAKDSMDGTMS